MGIEKLRGAPLCLLVVGTLELISGLSYSRQIDGVDHVMHGETQTADRVRCSASRCTSRSYWPSRRSTFFRLVPTFLTAPFERPVFFAS